MSLRYWQTRTHCRVHIVAIDDSWAVQTGKHLLQTQNVVSATNVARVGKQGNICVGNNVSATMCPRLPGPLGTFSHILSYNNWL